MKDGVVFKGIDYNNETLAHVLSFRGEHTKVNNKIVQYNLYLIACNGSGFDSYVVLNNLPQWRSVVNSIKNGAGIVSLRIFNSCVDQNKKLLNMFILDVEEFRLIKILKKKQEKVVNYKKV